MNIHPLIVHFPIAVLTLYGLLEIISLKKSRAEKFTTTKMFLLVVGVLGTASALQSGELAAENMGGRSDLVRMHSLFANITHDIFVGLLIVYLLPLAVELIQKNTFLEKILGWTGGLLLKIKDLLMRSYIYLVAVVVGMSTLMITGALGGAIVYGPDVDPVVRMVYDALLGSAAPEQLPPANPDDTTKTDVGKEQQPATNRGETTKKEQVTENTKPVEDTAPAGDAVKTYTLADIATHANQNSCWTTIGGNVYDITSYIPQHPGGPAKIMQVCGKDGSTLFQNQHGGQPGPERMLATFKIGVLAP